MSRFIIILAILISLTAILSGEIINISEGGNSVEILRSGIDETFLQYHIRQFNRTAVEINGKTWYHVFLEKEGLTLDEGFPQLPNYNRSIIIGDNSLVKFEIFDVEYQVFDMLVAPSKGLLLREVDPSDIPYTFNTMYQEDSFYPADFVSLSEPYILREFRGITIQTIPFQFNPQQEILRVCTSFKVRIYSDGIDDRNILTTPRSEVSRGFLPIYENHFLNWDTNRYTPISDSFGTLLIIYHDTFLDAITPYFSWKRQKGIPTILLPFSSVGTTAAQLQTYIQNYYTTNPNLTFVQIVGDHNHIPTLFESGGGADPRFSLVAGSDNYPDIFIGRFSASDAADVTAQVNKVITYEKILGSTATWPRRATGIASAEGPGDNGEYDWEHMNFIRDDLIAYGYTTVDQIYDPGATAAQVTTAITNGRGFVNYAGHGSTTSWTTTGFSNTQVNTLTNFPMTPFIMSVACYNGNFTSSTCFAEAWLRRSNGGAIAFYGSSIGQPWNPPMRAQDEVTDLLVAESKTTTGGLYFNGSCKMLDVYGTGAVSTFKTWNLFGDSTLLVRSKYPGIMTVTHPNHIPIGTSSVYVSTGVPGALVAITRNDVIHGRGYTNSSGNVTITLAGTPSSQVEYTITVTAFNKVTYLGTIYQGFIWTGNTSSVWSVSSNWNVGSVPNSSSDVLIPSGCTNYPVTSSANGYCSNLTIGYGASVTVGAYNLLVSNKAVIIGLLNMNNNSGDLVVSGEISWESGSTANITATSAEIYCGSHMTFKSGSNVQLAMGYLDFNGSSQSNLYNHSAYTRIHNIRANVSNPQAFIIHSSSTQDLVINGSFWNYAGKSSYNWYAGNTIIKGNITNYNTTTNAFQWHYKTLVLDGSNQTVSLANSTDYVNHLTASQAGTLSLANNLSIKGNLLIESGIFNAGNYSIKIAGNWVNAAGPDAFNENTSRVIFNGTGHQYCNYTENFNIIEVDKSGGALRVNNSSAVITCASYDWTAGAVDVLTGTFTANQLLDNGIKGAWYLNPSGTINLHNPGGWVDLNGDLYIYGGDFNVYGGTTTSFWPYSSNASLTMSSGNLVFHDQGVFITTTGSYSFTENITGGEIKVARSFTVNRTDFAPSGGTITLTGSVDATVSHLAGSYFHNLEIYKYTTRTDNITRTIYETDREGGRTEVFRSNTVTASSDLIINGWFWIRSGVFVAPDVINLKGGWWNYVGSAGFIEGEGLVVFEGTGVSNIYGETFNNLELNKSSTGQLIIPSAYTVSCNSYNWTSGTFTVNGGTFTALDLYDSGLMGTINLSAGTINFHQDTSQYFDLRGNLNISGGVLNLYGGGGTSYWPYINTVTLTRSDGVIDFHDTGLQIHSGSGSLTENITGGSIRMAKSFSSYLNDFTPSGGSLVMYSSTDATLHMNAGTLHNLIIDKSSARSSDTFDSTSRLIRDRDGTLLEETRANTVSLTTELNTTGNLEIVDGTFNLNGHEANIANNVGVSATLMSNSSSSKISSGNNFIWNDGGTAQLTEGEIECSSGWYVYNGASMVLPVEVSTYLTSVYARSIYLASPSTQFGNLIVGSSSPGVAYTVLSSSTEDLHIAGSLTVTEGNELDLGGRNLYVDGNISLSGKLDVHSNTVDVLGKPALYPTSHLAIGTGSFTYHDFSIPRNLLLYGTLTIISGTFHAVNNSLTVMPGSVNNISGGEIICTGINAVEPGTFQPAGGTVQIDQNYAGANYSLNVSSGNWFRNLIVNMDYPLSVILYNDLLVKGFLKIQSGIFDVSESNLTVTIEGNWINEVGPAHFNERNGEVIFAGSGLQFCVYTEEFNTIVLNKPGNVLRINNSGTTLTTDHYEWISGGIEVLNGTFTALDLINNGIFGSYLCQTGGVINLTNLDGYVDLNGAITITGGEMNVYGGTITSYWPYAANASITMSSSGILDFKDRGIHLFDSPSYSLSYDLAGGIIKTVGNLTCSRTDFNPAGGTFFMTGSIDTGIQLAPPNNLYNLTIDKTALRGVEERETVISTETSLRERDPEIADLSNLMFNNRSNMVYLSNNLNVTGSINIDNGIFNSNGHDLLCLSSVNVNNNSTLKVLEGSTLSFGNDNFLNVNNTGRLEVIGSYGNMSTISGVTGYYFFNVQSGGTIAAEYAIFENMRPEGLNIMNGSIVDLDYPLNNSIFRNGISGGTLLTLNNSQDLTIENAYFPTNTWSGANNVKKTADQGLVNFHDSTGEFQGAAYENDPYDRIFWTSASDLDLLITNAVWSDVSLYAGDSSTLTVTILNTGFVDIPTSVYLDLYYNLTSPPLPLTAGEQYTIINSLPPGEDVVFDFIVENFNPGDWNSWLQIDTDQEVNETDETNNTYGPIPITWHGLPDIADLCIECIQSTGTIHLTWTYPIWVTTFNIYRSSEPYFTPGPDNKVIRPDDTSLEYSEVMSDDRCFYRVMAERTPELTELPVRVRR